MGIPEVELQYGQVIAIDVAGEEFVVWRGGSGALGSAPRRCPHLDHDLAEGYVVGDELVCPGHGWGFDGRGHAYKRNEFGRVDAKGDVDALTLRVEEGTVVVDLR